MGVTCSAVSNDAATATITKKKTIEIMPSPLTQSRGVMADADEKMAKISDYGFTKYNGNTSIVAMMVTKNEIASGLIKRIEIIAKQHSIDYYENHKYHMFVCGIVHDEAKIMVDESSEMYRTIMCLNNVIKLMKKDSDVCNYGIDIGTLNEYGFISDIAFESIKIAKHSEAGKINVSRKIARMVDVTKFPNVMYRC